MKINEIVPIVVFDDRCYLCTKFAKVVDLFARNKIGMVGHYSELGREIRETILDSSALEMFWFIDGKTAFGGRAALIPLFKSILSRKLEKRQKMNVDELCDSGCRTIRAVFVRSASLISNSKKISMS